MHTKNMFARAVTDMHFSMVRQQVVLTQTVQVNILYNHHVVLVLSRKQRSVDYVCGGQRLDIDHHPGAHMLYHPTGVLAHLSETQVLLLRVWVCQLGQVWLYLLQCTGGNRGPVLSCFSQHAV